MPNVRGVLRRASARLGPRPRRAPNLSRILPDRRVLRERLGSPVALRERAVPLTVAGLVLVASILSVAPASGLKGSGDADALAGGPRLVAGGGVLGGGPTVDALAVDALARDAGAPALAAEQAADSEQAPGLGGQYLPDGTLLKPVTVDTEVPDARGRLADYYVRSGDTLTGIAHRFGISMMTLWWANDLKSKDELHLGQHLLVPPVDGLVVTVKAGDTLGSIASAGGVDAQTIADYNGLTDGTVVIGQMLILPGARGAAIPAPAATPKPAPATRTTSSTVQRTTAAPRYSGGKFYWPLPGHGINQGYHYGHYALDIAGYIGDPVHAAAAGVVIYAGWRNNGGGNVVWISHGSGLYTTYNHMSAVLVHTGQRVSRGQIVGRVGMTGWATGPHLHFEVWLGGAPGGVDRRVNPLRYY